MSLADAGRMGGENPVLKCKLFHDPGNNLPGRRIERPGDKRVFPSGLQVDEPGTKEIEGSAER
jgi:hypothetical protein